MPLRQLWRCIRLTVVMLLSSAAIIHGAPIEEDAADAHAEKRQYECPVPCGYYDQLCCNRNEICYTGANLEAECAPTASPIVQIQTVTLPVTIEVSNVSWAGAPTYTTATSTYTRLSTLMSTLTSAVTLQPTTTIMRQSSTMTAAHAGASNGTATAHSQSQHSGPRHDWGQAVVGAVVGAIALGLIIFGIWRWRKHRKAKALAAQNARADSFQPDNYAQMEHSQASSVVTQDPQAPMLQPRDSVIRNGPNPYEDGGTPAPPYPGSRSQTPQQAYGYSNPSRSQGHGSAVGGGSQNWPPSAVPPPARPPRRVSRRPVGGMPTRVESDDGF